MQSLDALASYSYLAWLRVFQASGLAFLFVPINMLSYTNVPIEKNNDVSVLPTWPEISGAARALRFSLPSWHGVRSSIKNVWRST